MPHFIFIQQISVLNILNMLHNIHFFSSKCRLFHNATLFVFCITHILKTGVLKFEKKNIRRQKVNSSSINFFTCVSELNNSQFIFLFYKKYWLVVTSCHMPVFMSILS